VKVPFVFAYFTFLTSIHRSIFFRDLFYVRNHLPVPDISEKDYELSISFGNKVHTLTLSDIKKFPKVTVTAAIMCAGNRRSEMSKVR